jgi:peptidoglycan hydrolase-like protein with peptidoglycan-binding domain
VPSGTRAKRLSLGTLAALTVGPASSLGEATAAQHAAPPQAPPTTTEHRITLDAGSKGNQVRKLQEALQIKADGIYGPETQAAVLQYQATHGLAVDGIAGPKTTTALAAGVPAQAPTLEDSVALVQAAVGVHPDGSFGPETYTAIESFQQAHGLNVDGAVGPETWQALDMKVGPTLVPPASAIPPPPAPEPTAQQSQTADGGVAHAASVDHSGEANEGDGGTSVPVDQSSESSQSASDGQAGGASDSGVVSRVEAAANEIATRPYVYGGGHGSFESDGYDCSGSVSYALHGGGLISSPEDSTALESYGESGPGRHITIYANSEHAYMVVNGRRFDTVALAEHGSRWSDSSGDDGGSFVERHPAGL